MPTPAPMGSRLTNILLAPIGWFAWYKLRALPTLNSMKRIPLMGWGIMTEFVPQVPNDSQGLPLEVIKYVNPLVVAAWNGNVVDAWLLDSEYEFIGIEWPGMTIREKNAFLDIGLARASVPHVPSTPPPLP